MQHRGSAVSGIVTEALAADLQRLTSNHVGTITCAEGVVHIV